MNMTKHLFLNGLAAASCLVAGCCSVPAASGGPGAVPAAGGQLSSAAIYATRDYDAADSWHARPEPLKLADTLLLGFEPGSHDASRAAFERVSNVYAPRATTGDEISAALDWYFRNINGSRPFAVADFSPGGRYAQRVLTDYRAQHPDAFASLVATYVTALGGDEDAFAANVNMPLARHTDETHVLVVWPADDATARLDDDAERRFEAFFERE